jgi:capreomycidine synthase
MTHELTLGGFAPAPLEDWYRHNYFHNEIDISGSGVQDYTFAEARKLAGIDLTELDPMSMGDGPTVGTEATRRVIAERFGNGDASRVMIANGSNEALQLVVRALVAPGDEIVAPSPCYHCHDKIAASLGCVVRRWDLRRGDHFAADLDSLASLVTKRTRVLVLNFPHNPTGLTLRQSDVERIVDLCRAHGIHLLWDAAFQEILYDHALVDPVRVYDKAISVGTFSKAYGLPGLRFGWIVADEQIINACVRQKDYGNLYVAPLIEHIARRVLIAGDAFTGPRFEQAKRNRDLVDGWLKGTGGCMGWSSPGGGVCGLVRLPAQTTDLEFCTRLLGEHGVLLVPGSCFDAPGFARLGFGGSSDTLQEGLARIGTFLRG